VLQEAPQLIAVHPRHHNVRDHEAHLAADRVVQQSNRAPRIRRLENVESLISQGSRSNRTYLRVVIDDENGAATPWRGVQRVSSCEWLLNSLRASVRRSKKGRPDP
jgi:hypothetical protein